MNLQEIVNYRLINQQISKSTSKTPKEVVSSLGAVQAQDYNGSLWAIGLRLKNATQADVEKEIAKRAIIRTWPMRGTIHFVSQEDVRLILSLYKKQGIMGYHRIIGIDEDVLEQGRKALIKAFSRKKPIQRRELHAALKKSGIPALRSNMARSHIMRRVARDGLMCFGPHEGKQATFVLLDDWVASKKQPTREEAIHMLASRYFASHGPATVKDFAWWSGLGISEARNGTAEVAHQLRKETFGNETYFMPKKIHKLQVDNQAAHLLPAFDEYLIAYKNRSAVLDPKYTHKVIAGSTLLFLPVILFDGRVIGTWKRRKSGKNAEIVLKPFTKLDNMQRESISIAAERYGKFIDSPIILK